MLIGKQARFVFFIAYNGYEVGGVGGYGAEVFGYQHHFVVVLQIACIQFYDLGLATEQDMLAHEMAVEEDAMESPSMAALS